MKGKKIQGDLRRHLETIAAGEIPENKNAYSPGMVLCPDEEAYKCGIAVGRLVMESQRESSQVILPPWNILPLLP